MTLRLHDRRHPRLVKFHRPLLLSKGGENSMTTSGEYCMTADTWAPVNLVMRYQIGAFEPYAGVGMGVFFSRFSMAGAGSSDATDVGFNTQLGLRYRVTNHFAVFCEWKLNYANLSHKDFLGAPGFDASADYLTHHLAMGVGYHF
jgi:opacity protein-like surface antigen